MNPRPYIGRFAPSPTGPLHMGSLLAALGSWLRARQAGGRWLVRIEDIDPPREIPGAADAQLRTLHAFGLVPDEPPVWQSRRSAHYQEALELLLQQGKAFACHCSRMDLAASNGIHRRCVSRHRRANPAIRLRVAGQPPITFTDLLQGPQRQDVAADVGDFVLRRADGPWAYQLAVVVDDAAQGITEVVRGADLLDSTPRQILLQRMLGLPSPGWLHLPLVCAADGRKLSKSLAAMPLDERDPLSALALAWQWLGQDPTCLDGLSTPAAWLHQATAAFDPDRLPRTLPPLAATHNETFMDSP
ncbi:MAG: tRNA glutamyl-Q(34) synthetase GluQRS [Pseudoxanthomonas suwonensis]|nr:tRNA glutamyl-Q(34) synthetase GluQRS [Pseudoxanthomonas suwonensis]